MKKKLNRVVRTADRVGDTVREKVIGYLLAGLGFVAGLAWNEAIKAAIDALIPAESNSLIAKFIYAFAITLLVVIVTLILVKLTKQSESELKKKK
jgi:hypothetical protein